MKAYYGNRRRSKNACQVENNAHNICMRPTLGQAKANSQGRACWFIAKAILLLFMCAGQQKLNAQVVYVYGLNLADNTQFLYEVDLATCEACPVMTLPFNNPAISGTDLVILPDGNLLSINGSNGTYIFDPPSSMPVESFSNNWYFGGVLAPNDLVYLSTFSVPRGLSSFDPATSTFTFIGQWPANILAVQELFYLNGVLYGAAVTIGNQPVLLEINVSDPSASVIVQNTVLGIGGLAEVGGSIYYVPTVAGAPISSYDIASNTLTTVCDLGLNAILDGMTAIPPGVAPEPCLCETNAGVLPTGGVITACSNQSLNVPSAGQTNLDNNDLLQYVIYTNPNDIEGSIIATSNSAQFEFAPPMETEVTYYVAAVAGNNLNGSVDLSDPCLDFSNERQIQWLPLPAADLSATAPDVCPSGCATVTVNLSGTAPFTLQYMTPGADAITETFLGQMGTFQVCVPVGTPMGDFLVRVISISDANCTCN